MSVRQGEVDFRDLLCKVVDVLDCLTPVHAEQTKEEASEDRFDAKHEAGRRGERQSKHALWR